MTTARPLRDHARGAGARASRCARRARARGRRPAAAIPQQGPRPAAACASRACARRAVPQAGRARSSSTTMSTGARRRRRRRAPRARRRRPRRGTHPLGTASCSAHPATTASSWRGRSGRGRGLRRLWQLLRLAHQARCGARTARPVRAGARARRAAVRDRRHHRRQCADAGRRRCRLLAVISALFDAADIAARARAYHNCLTLESVPFMSSKSRNEKLFDRAQQSFPAA